MSALCERCPALGAALGLGMRDDGTEVGPLTGGVASDIAVVALPARKICPKFALRELKEAEDWHAPVHRNAAEIAWHDIAARILPAAAVRLFGRSGARHGFGEILRRR